MADQQALPVRSLAETAGELNLYNGVGPWCFNNDHGQVSRKDLIMRRCFFPLLIVAVPQFIYAQGVGAKFGARDPHTCNSRKEPAKGTLTAEQVKKYFFCDQERVWTGATTFLNLVTDVKVEIGKGRPFNRSTDGFQNSDIDASEMVYPIRGGFTKWQCSPHGEWNVVPGKNCTKFENPNAGGTCWKSTFSEWHCTMLDVKGPEPVGNLPPPRGN